MKKYFFLIGIGLILSFGSCRKDIKTSGDEFDDRMITEKNKPFALGEEYMLYVISENNNNPVITGYCDSFFCKYIYGLPQRECFIFPVQLSVSGLNEVRKKNLSMLFLVDRQHDSAMKVFIHQHFPEVAAINNDSTVVRQYNHKWAYPQAITVISAANEEMLTRAIAGYASSLLIFYDKYEKIRTKRLVYAKGSNSTQNNNVYKAFNVSFSVPSGYLNIYQRLKGNQEKVLKENGIDALLWYRLKNESFSSDFMIYSLPYQEELNETDLLELRDKVSRQLVHGPNKGSYVAVAQSIYPPVSELVNVNGFRGLKITGLWETIGDWMGGPFIMFVLKDTQNKQLIVFDGFVYAPGIDKAPLVRRLEIIANTIRKTK